MVKNIYNPIHMNVRMTSVFLFGMAGLIGMFSIHFFGNALASENPPPEVPTSTINTQQIIQATETIEDAIENKAVEKEVVEKIVEEVLEKNISELSEKSLEKGVLEAAVEEKKSVTEAVEKVQKELEQNEEKREKIQQEIEDLEEKVLESSGSEKQQLEQTKQEKAEDLEEITPITETEADTLTETALILETVEQLEQETEQIVEVLDQSGKNRVPKNQQKEAVTEVNDVIELIEEIQQQEEEKQEIVEKLEKYQKKEEKVSSLSDKKFYEQKQKETETKLAEESLEQLKTLEQINQALEENFEETVAVEIKETLVEQESKKIQQETEALEQEIQVLEEILKTQPKEVSEVIKQEINVEIAEKKEALQKEEESTVANLKKAEEKAEKIAEILTEERVVEPPIFFALQSDITTTVPNDTEYSKQWGVQDVVKNISSSNVAVLPWNVPYNTSIKPVVVAVIDTGVDMQHEDLQGKFWKREKCVDENGEDIAGGCQNGGWDFVENDNHPHDVTFRHGTAVAGIVGAASNNAKGIVSLSGNNTEIMVLKACCSVEGFFEAKSISRAIRFAVENNADIINMSFGGPTPAKSIEDAIAYAEENGVLVVTAAGNYGKNNDEIAIYPANWNQKYSHLLSVAALNKEGALANFSNYGKSTVDIAAPGVSITSTAPHNAYEPFTGTSFSTPMVSAALAFWYSQNRSQ